MEKQAAAIESRLPFSMVVSKSTFMMLLILSKISIRHHFSYKQHFIILHCVSTHGSAPTPLPEDAARGSFFQFLRYFPPVAGSASIS
jgi:hypothetical protein